MHNELEAAFGQLLAERCTPAVVRAIESGESPDALWRDLVESGFLDALVPEDSGGAGLALQDVLPLVQASGYHALPLPFAETMAARAVAGARGARVARRPGHARQRRLADAARCAPCVAGGAGDRTDCRRRSARARNVVGLRPAALAVRQGDRQLPGGAAPAQRDGRAGLRGAHGGAAVLRLGRRTCPTAR